VALGVGLGQPIQEVAADKGTHGVADEAFLIGQTAVDRQEVMRRQRRST
jgi:hypothetical protein